jgi:hypothetical protein
MTLQQKTLVDKIRVFGNFVYEQIDH